MSVNDNTESVVGVPKVSVIMSVYNGEKYVCDAIDSILTQSFDDFELIVVNDNSNDKTAEILAKYNDERLIVINNDVNQGLTKNLNHMIALARGKYIARMDADDISYKGRLEKEVAVLERDESVQMVCTYANVFGKSEGIIETPSNYELLRAKLLFGNPITHSTVMFRKSIHHYYDEHYVKSQDYELWSRMVLSGEHIYTIEEPLVAYRTHDEQITKKGIDEQEVLTAQILINALKPLHVEISMQDQSVYASIIRHKRIETSRDLSFFEDIAKRIVANNKKYELYSEKALYTAMRDYYIAMLKYCLHHFNLSYAFKIFKLGTICLYLDLCT